MVYSLCFDRDTKGTSVFVSLTPWIFLIFWMRSCEISCTDENMALPWRSMSATASMSYCPEIMWTSAISFIFMSSSSTFTSFVGSVSMNMKMWYKPFICAAMSYAPEVPL